MESGGNVKERLARLKMVLDNSNSSKFHSEKILQLSTLKEAHAYCKYNFLNGQFSVG
jgi:hypothetical protein